MSAPLLEVKNLKKFFPIRSGLLLRHTADVKALEDVSFSVNRGETLGIVGESGCGKSTLGRTIVQLYTPTSGDIIFKGRNTSAFNKRELFEMRKNMQMIFQDPYASLNPRHTVGHILTEPLKVHGIGNSKEQMEKVAELMKKVGLNSDAANRYPHEFSGGQRQRISIARAVALNPELIVADEPVSALDVSIQAQVLNLMKTLQKELHLTFVFISHDLGVIEHMSSHVAVMYLGRIVEIAERDALFANPRHPYTKALLNAVPRIGKGKNTQSRALTGEVPSPINPPSGCTFHPRCPLAKAECKIVVPKLVPVSAHHQVACHTHP